jgi:hypothetical protein
MVGKLFITRNSRRGNACTHTRRLLVAQMENKRPLFDPFFGIFELWMRRSVLRVCHAHIRVLWSLSRLKRHIRSIEVYLTLLSATPVTEACDLVVFSCWYDATSTNIFLCLVTSMHQELNTQCWMRYNARGLICPSIRILLGKFFGYVPHVDPYSIYTQYACWPHCACIFSGKQNKEYIFLYIWYKLLSYSVANMELYTW